MTLQTGLAVPAGLNWWPAPSAWTTVLPAGEIDVVTAPSMFGRIMAASAETGLSVVVDFTNVTFVDAAASTPWSEPATNPLPATAMLRCAAPPRSWPECRNTSPCPT
jgi:hypothetical protein